MATSVKIPETITYNNPESGLEGKNLTWKKKSEIRNEASKAIKENHELHAEYHKLLRQLEKHEIINVRNTLSRTIFFVKIGLQDTYDVIFEELLLLKDKLEKDIEFIEKHGIELEKKDLDVYRYELLSRMTAILDNLEHLYISNVVDAINNEDFAKFKIETLPEEGFFRLFTEKLLLRSLIDKTYKEERRLAKLDKAGRKAMKIINENKRYYDDFGKITDKMLLYNLVLIKRSNDITKIVEDAIKNFDLVPSYSEFTDALREVLQKEVNSLRSLKKSISQIRNLIKKADDILSKQQEKKIEVENAS